VFKIDAPPILSPQMSDYQVSYHTTLSN